MLTHLLRYFKRLMFPVKWELLLFPNSLSRIEAVMQIRFHILGLRRWWWCWICLN